MVKPPAPVTGRTTLSLKLGRAFEAHATGWGVAAVPLVVVLLVVAALAAGGLR